MNPIEIKKESLLPMSDVESWDEIIAFDECGVGVQLDVVLSGSVLLVPHSGQGFMEHDQFIGFIPMPELELDDED